MQNMRGRVLLTGHAVRFPGRRIVRHPQGSTLAILTHPPLNTLPPPPPPRPDPNPYTSLSDLRALAEKRAKARRLDEEWRHRQSLRTKFSGRDVYNDVRAQVRRSGCRVQHIYMRGGEK